MTATGPAGAGGSLRSPLAVRRRRRALGVLLALLALLVPATAGCGGPTTAPAPEPDRSRPLIVASDADLTAGGQPGVRRALIDQWNRRNPDRPARLVELPSASDEQRSELIGAFQSGTAAYDVVNLDISWIAEFADSGLLRPLDPALVDGDFLRQAADAGRWKGRTYAVPFNTDVGLLYYRTDDLAKAGRRPADLRGYAKIGDLLADVRPLGHAAYTTQLRAYEGLTVNTLETFWTAGVELVDGDGRYIGTEDGLREGLDELGRLGAANNLNPESLEADESVTLAQFTEGQSVLMRNWPYAYNRLDAALAPGVRFGVARLPGVAALGGQSLGVAATSDRPGDAADLIRFLTGRGAQHALLSAGFAPARRSAYGAGDVNCDDPHDPRAWFYDRPAGRGSEPSPSPSAATPGYTTLLWCALQAARARPATAHYVTFTRVLQREVHGMLAAHRSADASAERLGGRLGRALGGRGPG
ncbi:extracellular solute-binding protein [Actinacidiphila glaucinigra]|uniref:extracellular solute-binding protein n=1 Tax=Actinacidiphila glaucinigra TaxID=235986 RepID=UPI00386798A6